MPRVSVLEDRTVDRAQPGVDVLLVDDDPAVLDLLAAQLRARGLKVEEARSADEALKKLQANPPDVVVADVRMPGMSGYELCRRARQLGHDETPFIFCSAVAEPSMRVTGLRVGGDDYVPKSADSEELLLRIQKHLQRARRMRSLKVHPGGPEAPRAAFFSGCLGAVTVPDLFQIVHVLLLDPACVRLEGRRGRRAEAFVAGGRLVHARTAELAGQKAFARMLTWEQGRFSIDATSYPGEPSMCARLDASLYGAVAEWDECRALRQRLGEAESFSILRHDLLGGGLDDATRGVLELVGQGLDLEALIDHSPRREVETLGILAELVRGGVIVPVPCGVRP